MDGNALVLCQCCLGTGRLAVLERWSHYRGGRQCFSALSVLFEDREVGCFREKVTLQRYSVTGTGVSAILIGIREVGCFIEVAATYIQRPS